MPLSLLGLRTVIYPSPDLGAAKSWWTSLLGVEPYFDEPFYVGYNVGGGGIVTATVRNPSDMVVGFIFNPHFSLA